MYRLYIYVPYIQSGLPIWQFAHTDLAQVRESVQRYHGDQYNFIGIYELLCEETDNLTLNEGEA